MEGNHYGRYLTDTQTGAIDHCRLAATQFQGLTVMGFERLTELVHFPEQLANIETRFYLHG